MSNAATTASPSTPSQASATDFDAIVIGAGFGGLRALHELRELGLRARVIEAGSDVGGTWYYNRYPGARTDSEAWLYAYSFSKEIQDTWNWSERFPSWDESLAYLRYVADFCDMRRDIQFNTRVKASHYDEVGNQWTVLTEAGERFTATYLIAATGPLSTPYKPDFPGFENYKGEWYLTGNWPHEPVDFANKRVVVIGTGATAVQLIPIVAEAASQLTVLQRTPNYVLPARNAPMNDYQRAAIRRNYDKIWARTREQAFGFDFDDAGRNVADVSPEECQQLVFLPGFSTAATVTDAVKALVDIIQINCVGRNTARLTVHYPIGDGIFYFADGEVVDARLGNLIGIDGCQGHSGGLQRLDLASLREPPVELLQGIRAGAWDI